ncbi:MAG: hypothetical protein NTZ17_09585 [Phycisphaerae bacterium]|nr:hypothetical protein [Phycisphaerae bacterium]
MKTRDSAGCRAKKTPVVAAAFSTDTLIGYEEANVATDAGPTVKRLDVGDPVVVPGRGSIFQVYRETLILGTSGGRGFIRIRKNPYAVCPLSSLRRAQGKL